MTYGHPDQTVERPSWAAFSILGGKILLGTSALVTVSTLAATIGLSLLCMLLWGIASAWHFIAWGITIFALLRFARRLISAYKEGRNS